MARIFQLTSTDHCWYVTDDLPYDQVWSLAGNRVADSWDPPRSRKVDTRGPLPLRPADLIVHRGGLIMTRSACDRIGSALAPWGEFLPLPCDGFDVVAFNPAVCRDALDLDASEVPRFADGRIMYVSEFAFRPDAIGPVPIFRVAEERRRMFATSALLEIVRGSGLVGVDFIQRWADEPGDPPPRNDLIDHRRLAKARPGAIAGWLLDGTLIDAEMDDAMGMSLSNRDVAESVPPDWPDAALAFYATWWFESEVDNGGFSQAVFNRPYMFVPTIRGYELLGRSDLAAQVAGAAKAADRETASRVRARSARTVDAAFGYFRESKLDSLTDRWYASPHDASAERAALVRRAPEDFEAVR